MENFDYQKAYELFVGMTQCAFRVRRRHIIIKGIFDSLPNNPSISDTLAKADEARPYYLTWKDAKQRYDALRKAFEPFINDDNGRTVEYLDLLVFEYGDNI